MTDLLILGLAIVGLMCCWLDRWQQSVEDAAAERARHRYGRSES